MYMTDTDKKEILTTIAGYYENPDLQKQQISTDNKNKIGIYR